MPNGKPDERSGVSVSDGNMPDGSARFYIAHNTFAGFDEIQTLALNTAMGKATVIEGLPGTGKTSAVEFIAGLFGRPLIKQTMSADYTEGPIIGQPTITGAYENGAQTQAMEQGAMYLADEVSQLRDTVLMSTGSALDHQRAVRRRDGKVIHAKPEFVFFGAYNKGHAGKAPFEFPHAWKSRVDILDYELPTPDLEARIMLVHSGIANVDDVTDEQVEQRYIGMDGTNGKAGKGLVFAVEKKKKAINFLTNAEVAKPAHSYLFYKGDLDERLTAPGHIKEAYDMAHKFALFADVVRKKIIGGDLPIPQAIKDQLGPDPQGKIVLALPTTRELIDVMGLYKAITSMGADETCASTFLTDKLVRNIVYGQLADKKVGVQSARDYLRVVAAACGLIEFRVPDVG